MMYKAAVALSLASTTFAAAARRDIHKGFGDLSSLVVFGDSYTDEGRLGYILNNNGALPPNYFMPSAATMNSTADGGRIWARHVSDDTGLKLYNYAVSGAVCSNKLTARYSSGVHGYYPDIEGYEVPQFMKEHTITRYAGANNLNPDKTVFAIWIGTNDLGNGALLTDEHAPGVSLPDVTDCVIDQIKSLYAYGARKFIILNDVPLQKTPQYTENGPNHYFPERDTFYGGNITAINQKIGMEVRSANQIWKYQLPAVAASLRGSSIAQLDTYSIIEAIYANPMAYLDPPYNVTGYAFHCATVQDCATWTNTVEPNLGSFIWYDELHPSERTETIIAKEFEKALRKESTYASYYF